MSSPARPARLWIGALAALFPLTFLAAVPWLKTQPDVVVHVVAGVAATGVVAASFLFSILKDQALDEWSRAGEQFAVRWGFLAGAALVAVLTALTPVQDLVVAAAAAVARPDPIDDTAVRVIFIAGFITVVLAQTLCTIVLSLVWRIRMARPAEPS